MFPGTMHTPVLVLEVFLLLSSGQASESEWKTSSSWSVSASPGTSLPQHWSVNVASPNGSSSQRSSLSRSVTRTLFGPISLLPPSKQNNAINDVKSLSNIPKGNGNDKLSNVKTDREGYTNGYHNEYPNGYNNAYDQYDNKKAFDALNVLEQTLPVPNVLLIPAQLPRVAEQVPLEVVHQVDRAIPIPMPIIRKVPQPVDRPIPIPVVHPVPEPVVVPVYRHIPIPQPIEVVRHVPQFVPVLQRVAVDRPVIIERKIPVPEPFPVMVDRPIKVPFVPHTLRIEHSHFPIAPLRARFFTSASMCPDRALRHPPFFRTFGFKK